MNSSKKSKKRARVNSRARQKREIRDVRELSPLYPRRAVHFETAISESRAVISELLRITGVPRDAPLPTTLFDDLSERETRVVGAAVDCMRNMIQAAPQWIIAQGLAEEEIEARIALGEFSEHADDLRRMTVFGGVMLQESIERCDEAIKLFDRRKIAPKRSTNVIDFSTAAARVRARKGV